MIFGKNIVNKSLSASLYLNNAPLDFTDEWKYLGTTIVAGKSMGFTV